RWEREERLGGVLCKVHLVGLVPAVMVCGLIPERVIEAERYDERHLWSFHCGELLCVFVLNLLLRRWRKTRAWTWIWGVWL
ncbi:hypothetical protein DL96DRAFT_1583644, partial [Flagelloscypha sp. PMI_526]